MIEALEPSERARLRQFLIARFDLNGLKDLAFDLGVDYQLFSHDTKPDIARELITYFEQRAELSCLVMEIMRRRSASEIADILAKLPTCSPRKIVVIIVWSNDLLETVSGFRDEFASKLHVPKDEVVVIGAAHGSMRLLVSVPEKATGLRNVSEIHNLGDGKYQVSITLFDTLDVVSRGVWRLVACDHLPIRDGDVLRPTIVWQDALKEVTRENSFSNPSTPSEQLQRNYRSELLDLLAGNFSEPDLRELCFELNDPSYGSLRGEGKREKARELIQYLEYRQRLNELLDLIERKRSFLKKKIEDMRAAIPISENEVGQTAQTPTTPTVAPVEHSPAKIQNQEADQSEFEYESLPEGRDTENQAPYDSETALSPPMPAERKTNGIKLRIIRWFSSQSSEVRVAIIAGVFSLLAASCALVVPIAEQFAIKLFAEATATPEPIFTSTPSRTATLTLTPTISRTVTPTQTPTPEPTLTITSTPIPTIAITILEQNVPGRSTITCPLGGEAELELSAAVETTLLVDADGFADLEWTSVIGGFVDADDSRSFTGQVVSYVLPQREEPLSDIVSLRQGVDVICRLTITPRSP